MASSRPSFPIRIALNRLAVAASIIITFFNHIFHSRALAGQAPSNLILAAPVFLRLAPSFHQKTIYTYLCFCSTFFLEPHSLCYHNAKLTITLLGQIVNKHVRTKHSWFETNTNKNASPLPHRLVLTPHHAGFIVY